MIDKFKDADQFRLGETFPLLNLDKIINKSGERTYEIRSNGMVWDIPEPFRRIVYEYQYPFLLDCRDYTIPFITSLLTLESRTERRRTFTPLDPSEGHVLDVQVDYNPTLRQASFDNETGNIVRNPLRLSFDVSEAELYKLHPEYVSADYANYGLYEIHEELLEDLKRLRVSLGVPTITPTKLFKDPEYMPGMAFNGFPDGANTSIRKFYNSKFGPMPPVQHYLGGHQGLEMFLPIDPVKCASLSVNFFRMDDEGIKAEGLYQLR